MTRDITQKHIPHREEHASVFVGWNGELYKNTTPRRGNKTNVIRCMQGQFRLFCKWRQSVEQSEAIEIVWILVDDNQEKLFKSQIFLKLIGKLKPYSRQVTISLFDLKVFNIIHWERCQKGFVWKTSDCPE
jgi:hypothetical protein